MSKSPALVRLPRHPPCRRPKWRRPSQRLSREEILALLRACGEDASGIRLAALIAVGWRSGLRIREALALVPGDVDPTRGKVYVQHGKGDHERHVGLGP